MNECSCMV